MKRNRFRLYSVASVLALSIHSPLLLNFFDCSSSSSFFSFIVFLCVCLVYVSIVVGTMVLRDRVSPLLFFNRTHSVTVTAERRELHTALISGRLMRIVYAERELHHHHHWALRVWACTFASSRGHKCKCILNDKPCSCFLLISLFCRRRLHSIHSCSVCLCLCRSRLKWIYRCC